jgi:hypothetical protein
MDESSPATLPSAQPVVQRAISEVAFVKVTFPATSTPSEECSEGRGAYRWGLSLSELQPVSLSLSIQFQLKGFIGMGNIC